MLAIRRDNVTQMPTVKFHACPVCESTDWAMSAEMIGTDRPAAPPSMWQRLMTQYLGTGQ
jgi:hypothetical protein